MQTAIREADHVGDLQPKVIVYYDADMEGVLCYGPVER
ncbi:hypothetical protein L284_09715 [Novosphingobium lindaniclasticum LE124]|uniref:Uncharacterized protein n=1 Tax=Novosphingobium lindaniclasticum LE124 TaxID=1096930 RepID=T0HIY7_9SPHN|nr:hypothetical protein L284_09715 [Novosphingobium lindaniclasticum LE124]